jgi:hypothetical protein
MPKKKKKKKEKRERTEKSKSVAINASIFIKKMCNHS